MKIFKPEWIKHTQKHNVPIYSIHINPKNNKIATGGQDYKIRIWSLEPIQKESKDHKLLSTCVLHDGAVLCVRWSQCGKYLASGSDDTKIAIWELDDSANRRPLFDTNVVNIENYRVIKLLIGHNSDVADLAWSADQQYLASCGFDSKVCIWDAESFDRIITIEPHSAFVKGLCWDPAGKYLVTQADDNTVKIIRSSDWRVEKEILAPYENVASTTFFRRLSWAPDGSAIATANGESSGICVSPILYRENWQTAVCLVGHEAPIEVAAFNPYLFKFTDIKTKTRKDSAVCALGSQDNGISIWWTGSSRAIACAQHLFTHSVLDICWTADGLGLLACSYDGTVVYMEFDESEFGARLSEGDVENVLQTLGSKKSKSVVPESSEILLLEKKLESSSSNLANRLTDGQNNTQIGFNTPIHKDKIIEPNQAPLVQITPNGAVIDMVLEENTIANNNSVDIPMDSNNVTSTPKKSGDAINISPMKNNNLESTPTKAVVSTPTKEIILEKQTYTVNKDGKKRIRPVLVEANHVAVPSPTKQSNIQSAQVKRAKTNSRNDESNQTQVEYTLPLVKKLDSHISLEIPKPRTSFSLQSVHPFSARLDTFEFKNSMVSSLCTLTATQGSEIIWTFDNKSPCLLAVKGDKFLALTFINCTLQILNVASGRRLLPPLQMDSAATYLHADGAHLVYIDCNGTLKLWDISIMKNLLETNVLCLLDDKSHILNVGLHSNGQPIISTSANATYLYSNDMKCWMSIYNGDSLLNKVPRALPKLDYIELCFISSIQLNNPDSVKYWLKLYCRKLCDENAATKTKELLDLYYTSIDEQDDCLVGGVSKQELFDIAYDVVAKNRGFQRFLTKYSK